MARSCTDVSGPGGTKYTFEQLPDAIKALQNGEDIDYEGASGPIDLDEQGDPTAGVYDIYRYKGGKIDVHRRAAGRGAADVADPSEPKARDGRGHEPRPFQSAASLVGLSHASRAAEVELGHLRVRRAARRPVPSKRFWPRSST